MSDERYDWPLDSCGEIDWRAVDDRLRAAEAVCQAAENLIRRQSVTFAAATDGARVRLRETVAKWRGIVGK